MLHPVAEAPEAHVGVRREILSAFMAAPLARSELIQNRTK
jgi:hypothetical protein